MTWRRAALSVALLLSSHAGFAGQKLVVGVEDLQYLPVYSVVRGEYRGFARELLDAFAADRGYEFEYRPLPVTRLFASFFDGKLDLKFPDNPAWQPGLRKGHTVSYSDPVITTVDGAFVTPARREATLDQVRTLGTVTGFTPWAWLDRVEAGKVELRENSDFNALVQQAMNGRFDAAYASVAVVNYQLEQAQRPGALLLRFDLPHARDHYHLATLQHPEVVTQFNAWLKDRAAWVTALKERHGVEKGLPH